MNEENELIKLFPAMEDGAIPTSIDGVLVFQETCYTRTRPMVYNPGVCVVIQGRKVGYLGDKTFEYNPNNYLVTSVTMPFWCESFGSIEEPLRGLYIDIDIGLLRDLMGRVEISEFEGKDKVKTLPLGIGPAGMDDEMTDAVLRLLKSLHSETEAEVLGPGIVREILFRVLQGCQKDLLYAIGMHNGAFSQVARVLKTMQNNYAENINVEKLASTAHMSVSAFHRAFKEVTSDSPIQYLKKIRLTRARDMMVQESMKAYSAADMVGYESVSQFSREFKRYFGKTPSEVMQEMRVN